MKLLITGFKEFGGMRINPSRVLIESLKDIRFNSNNQIDLVTALLPVDFDVSGNLIKDLILKEKPDVLIMTGVDLGKKKVTIENSARKHEKYLNMSNCEKLPAKMYTQIGIKKIFDKLTMEGYELAFSNDSGLFVCNHVYYVSNFIIQEKALVSKALFIHIPYPYPYYTNRKKITPDITIKDIRNTFIVLLGEIILQELNKYA